MENLQINHIEKEFKGKGHWKIDVYVSGLLQEKYIEDETEQVEDKKISATTTNSMAVDAAFDREYNEKIEEEDDRYYESREQAIESLIDHVFQKNEIVSSYDLGDI